MPIEMTERLERALEYYSEYWGNEARNTVNKELLAAYREARDAASEEQGDGCSGCVGLTVHHTCGKAPSASARAAYREARDAPKTGRFEVGQRVYRRSGRSGLVKEHRLGVLPDDGPADGYLETWLSADVQAAPSEEQGEAVGFFHPHCKPDEDGRWSNCPKCATEQGLASITDTAKKWPEAHECPGWPCKICSGLGIGAYGGRFAHDKKEIPLTVERLVRVLRELYAEDDDFYGLADALEGEEE